MSTTGVNGAHSAFGARDAVLTGMGFCLPGDEMPVFTAEQLWDVAAHGRSCLRRDDVFYGSVDLPAEAFDRLVPSVAGRFSEHFTDAHRFGLLSLAAACEDAGLDPAAGELGDAAVLVGRGGVDTNVGNYLAILDADPDKVCCPWNCAPDCTRTSASRSAPTSSTGTRPSRRSRRDSNSA